MYSITIKIENHPFRLLVNLSAKEGNYLGYTNFQEWDDKLSAFISIFRSNTQVKEIFCLNKFEWFIIYWFPHDFSTSTTFISKKKYYEFQILIYK